MLNWHCLDDLKKANQDGDEVWVRLGGRRAPLPRAATADEVPAALKVAESAGLDFTLLPTPPGLASNTPLIVAPPRIAAEDVVGLSQDGAFVATCRVQKVCGSRISYDRCTAPPRKGWSGSGVWSLKDDRPQLIGMHKDGPDVSPEGSARLLSAIMGRSSILAESDETFSDTFARSSGFRFRDHPPGSCSNDTGRLSVRPFMMQDGTTIQGLAKLDERTLLTSDLFTGRICRYRWPSTKGDCWSNPDPQYRRVNALLPLTGGQIALAKANDGTAAGAGAIRLFHFDDAGRPTFEDDDIPAPIGTVYGLAETGGDLIAIGSRGVCTVAVAQVPRRCVVPEKGDVWRANGVLPLGPELFVAVGRDKADGLGFPVCKWFERKEGRWRRVGQCVRGEALLSTARTFKANGRSFQFKAPVMLAGRVIAFGSDGSAYELRPDYRPRRVPIIGIVHSGAQLEDSVRDVKVIDADHVALAANDGAFRIVKLTGTAEAPVLQAFDVGDRYTAFDLAIWTTQIVVGTGWALVRGQDGGVRSVSWTSLP